MAVKVIPNEELILQKVCKAEDFILQDLGAGEFRVYNPKDIQEKKHEVGFWRKKIVNERHMNLLAECKLSHNLILFFGEANTEIAKRFAENFSSALGKDLKLKIETIHKIYP